MIWVILVFGGCASNKVKSPDAWEQGIASLRHGMTMEQVRSLFGEPGLIRPFAESRVDAQIWVYQRRTVQKSTMEPLNSREVAQFDPVLKVTRTVKEPIYSQVEEVLIEEVHLLWANGQLMRWRKKQHVESKMLL